MQVSTTTIKEEWAKLKLNKINNFQGVKSTQKNLIKITSYPKVKKNL